MSATIDNTLTTRSQSPQPANPLTAARAGLVSEFLRLVLPRYPKFPAPSDHESVAQHIRDVANIFDRYLAAIGSEVRDNAVTAVDGNLFSGSFLGAVDGNETYAAERQAEALREYASERRRA